MSDDNKFGYYVDRAKEILGEIAMSPQEIRRRSYEYLTDKGMPIDEAYKYARQAGENYDAKSTRSGLIYGMNPVVAAGQIAAEVPGLTEAMRPSVERLQRETQGQEQPQPIYQGYAGGGAVDDFPLERAWREYRQGFAGGGSKGQPQPQMQPQSQPQMQPQEGTIASIIKRGEPIPAQMPHPTPQEQQAALADTRTGGDIVAKRLNVLVPERDRVVGGQYTPGAPGGGRWSDLPEELLNRKGAGFKVTDEELNKLWEDAVNRSSAAAKAAVEKHKVRPQFFSKDWDKAMQLPLRDHLWYELSGEKMAENLPDLTAKEFMHGMDLVGATSARAKPGENLERALAILSQHMRNVPVDVDITIPETARQALSRSGMESSALPGNKTGYFSDTLALTGGVPTRMPISVNDVWVGRMFGVPDDVMSSNQSLHEPMSIYFNNIRDLYNERHGHELPFKYQSWNFQAPAWVHLRGEEAGEESGDAYHQVWGGIINKLKKAGIPGIDGDKITREALMHPGFADALRRTTKPFREAPKATVEFGTKLTPTGQRAYDVYAEAKKFGDQKTVSDYESALSNAMYASARGKGHAWESLKKAITGDLSSKSDITRIMHGTSDRPFDVGGSFEGTVSPNIRIPLGGMNDDHLAEFNAIAGSKLNQAAMAISQILHTEPGAQPKNGYIRGHSAFIPTTEPMDPKDIEALSKELMTKGHDISFARYPNGYLFDVNPNFGPAGAKGIDADTLGEAVDSVLGGKYGDPKLIEHDYRSVYNTADEFAGHRNNLVKRIEDEFLQAALSAGIKKGDARKALRKSTLPDNFTGRSKKAWNTYRSRLGYLASAERQFEALAQRVNNSHAALISKAEKRATKYVGPQMAQQQPPAAQTPLEAAPNMGEPEAEPRARGGRAFGLHPVHKIPGVHIVTADAGEPIFTGEK